MYPGSIIDLFHVTSQNVFTNGNGALDGKKIVSPIQIVLNWPTLPSYHLKTVGTRGLNLVPEDRMKCPLQIVYGPFLS